MSYRVPEVKILDVRLRIKQDGGSILCHFDCEIDFIRLYGCPLFINEMGRLSAGGPLTTHKRNRVAFVSSMGVICEMVRAAVPVFVAAGGVIPPGTKLSPHFFKEGELNEYLH